MKMPQFSIAWIITVVGVIAIDLAAIRAIDGMDWIGLLIVSGSMPMASILVLGIPSVVRGFSDYPRN
jgi:hypothetical protein